MSHFACSFIDIENFDKTNEAIHLHSRSFSERTFPCSQVIEERYASAITILGHFLHFLLLISKTLPKQFLYRLFIYIFFFNITDIPVASHGYQETYTSGYRNIVTYGVFLYYLKKKKTKHYLSIVHSHKTFITNIHVVSYLSNNGISKPFHIVPFHIFFYRDRKQKPSSHSWFPHFIYHARTYIPSSHIHQGT